MRIRKLATTIALVGILALSITSCKADQIRPSVPDNVASLQAEQPGVALKNYGYTPVVTLRYTKDLTKIAGYVFVNCGLEQNLGKCSSELHNRGAKARPNVYTQYAYDKQAKKWTLRVTQLEGPHASLDDRSYYASVPEPYQVFEALTPSQQADLLGIMPEVIKTVGTYSYKIRVNTYIGTVWALLTRGELNR